MKKILIPIDFSELSIHAVRAGAELAFKMEAELVLFHAIEGEEDPKEVREKLDVIFKMKEVRGVRNEYKQELGDVVDEVSKAKVDLVVMASKGAKGLKSFFVGTHAEKIAQHATCPVIIIKGVTDLINMKSIVFPTNMDMNDEDIIKEIKEIQAFYDAKLHIVKAYDDSLVMRKDVEKRLKDFAEFHTFENYTVNAREGIDQADVILNFAEEVDGDLIAMATHDRHGIDKLLSGHISGEVINTSQRPIWVKSLELED